MPLNATEVRTILEENLQLTGDECIDLSEDSPFVEDGELHINVNEENIGQLFKQLRRLGLEGAYSLSRSGVVFDLAGFVNPLEASDAPQLTDEEATAVLKERLPDDITVSRGAFDDEQVYVDHVKEHQIGVLYKELRDLGLDQSTDFERDDDGVLYGWADV